MVGTLMAAGTNTHRQQTPRTVVNGEYVADVEVVQLLLVLGVTVVANVEPR